VTGNKKKIVSFLAAIALVSVGLFILSRLGESRSHSEAVQLAIEGAESKVVNQQSRFEAGALFANDPNFSARVSDNSATRELFFKTMLAVLLVIVLGAAAIYTSKKLLPRITNLPGKRIHILETVHLGPRKTVHLIEVGGQQLLIGSTNENITTLADLTGFASIDIHRDLPTSKSSSQEIESNMVI